VRILGSGRRPVVDGDVEVDGWFAEKGGQNGIRGIPQRLVVERWGIRGGDERDRHDQRAALGG